mgnify:CR=1 FL=1
MAAFAADGPGLHRPGQGSGQTLAPARSLCQRVALRQSRPGRVPTDSLGQFRIEHVAPGIYLDLQNVTKSVLRQQDVLMSTGVVENPEAPASEQRYVMKRLKQESGTLLPTIGLTVEF